MDEFSVILLAIAAFVFFALGPLSFFLTMGARSRIDETQRLVRSLDARLSQLQLQMDRLIRAGAADAAPAASRHTCQRQWHTSANQGK